MKDSSLKAQKLFEFDRRLVASSAYLKTQKTPKSPNDLSDWDWIDLAPVRGQETSVVKRSNATNKSLSFGSRQDATRRQWFPLFKNCNASVGQMTSSRRDVDKSA